MTDGYDEDLRMYEEAGSDERRQLDNAVLLRPISDLNYPKNPLAVGPDKTVGEVLDLMTEKRYGAILICEDEKVIGIFTERDALMKGLYAVARRDHKVTEFMTANPDCLMLHDPIAAALNRMAIGAYRHIPIVDAQHRPIGMCVMRDVVRYVVSFFPAEVLNVPPHSEHNPPDRDIDGG